MRALLALCAMACGAAVLAGAAAASTPPVSLVGCALQHGGQATVPAGTDVSFRFGWVSRTDRLTDMFLRTVNTTATVDGNPVADANSYWGAPVDSSNGSTTTWLYDTGITLGSGESLTLVWDSTLSHPVTDGFGPPVKGDLSGGPLTCTVTGA